MKFQKPLFTEGADSGEKRKEREVKFSNGPEHELFSFHFLHSGCHRDDFTPP